MQVEIHQLVKCVTQCSRCDLSRLSCPPGQRSKKKLLLHLEQLWRPNCWPGHTLILSDQSWCSFPTISSQKMSSVEYFQSLNIFLLNFKTIQYQHGDTEL